MTAGLGVFSASDSERRERQQRSHLQHGQRWTAEQQQCQQCQRGRADWENSEFQVPKRERSASLARSLLPASVRSETGTDGGILRDDPSISCAIL